MMEAFVVSETVFTVAATSATSDAKSSTYQVGTPQSLPFAPRHSLNTFNAALSVGDNPACVSHLSITSIIYPKDRAGCAILHFHIALRQPAVRLLQVPRGLQAATRMPPQQHHHIAVY